MQEKTIGIMGAMPEEIEEVVRLLENKTALLIGMRTYFSGTINGIKTVVVFSRWGKVAAATTVSTLILQFKITELIFTGVAGAVSPMLKTGDIVVAQRLIQHDMDARPVMPQFEIPLLKKTYFEVPEEKIKIATAAVAGFISSIQHDRELEDIGIASPKFYTGDIASGDKFFSSTQERDRLLEKLPGLLCVEMEGAAVAQVCYEYGLPFTIIRSISDAADDTSHIDFPVFVEKVAGRYSAGIVREIYKQFQ
jgi:adenosylhomocysteine nucleosidase